MVLNKLKNYQTKLVMLNKVVNQKRLSVIIVFILFLFSFNCEAQINGNEQKSLSMKSEVLNHLVNYTIYLPPNYDKDDRDYPVLYLLHGFTDNENTWVENGFVDKAVEQVILIDDIDEMIIVMPDGGLSWYVNQPNGKFDYEDMFINELIPYIEFTYRIKSNRKNRFIGGLSMGGYGALGYTMRHLDTFSVCIALSSAIKTDNYVVKMSQENFDYLYQSVYGKNIKGYNRISEHWNTNNPLFIINELSDVQLKSMKWYLSCGDKDDLLEGNIALNKIFRNRKIPHEFRVKAGQHNWEYWRSEIKEGLKFINQTN